MEKLVDHLRDAGILKTPRIIEAFLAIDRRDFVPADLRRAAYDDVALPIGFGQTISQPYTVAFMLEQLQPKAGDKILDVGCGSGWTTALLASIAGPQGQVFGVEVIAELVEVGRQNIAKYNFPHATIVQAGKKLGLPEQAPFHKILASAAANSLPKELVQQLHIPGTLVIPVRDSVLAVRRTSETKTHIQTFPGFVFVPLA